MTPPQSTPEHLTNHKGYVAHDNSDTDGSQDWWCIECNKYIKRWKPHEGTGEDCKYHHGANPSTCVTCHNQQVVKTINSSAQETEKKCAYCVAPVNPIESKRYNGMHRVCCEQSGAAQDWRGRDDSCVFCKLLDDFDPELEIINIEPLNPVVPGHRLIIPRKHVPDFSSDPETTALVMKYAATVVKEGEYNIITSKGESATQSVFHLHVHLVPRVKDDGLHLPWTNQIVSPVDPTK